MSPRLPVVSGKEMIAAPERIGYEVARQRGSHVRMRHPDAQVRRPVTVPAHKELRVGLVRAILRDAGLTGEEFSDLLRR
jgi:predicted RNA binding protein YcfA (HicA-like mRNA interferase family)